MELSVCEEKKVILNLLTFFDQVCRENKLNYSLAGGSLLGAIRHHGFIPWDDDADVIMPREDYEKFKLIMYSNYCGDTYGFLDENCNNYYYLFSKLYDKSTIMKTILPIDAKLQDLGVFLDIFPYDNVPDDDGELTNFSNDLNLLNDKMYMTLPGQYALSRSKVKHIIKKYLLFPKFLKTKIEGVTTEAYKEMILKKIQSYDTVTTTRVGFLLSEYRAKDRIPVEIATEFMDVLFEGHIYRCFKEYDVYLHNLYGDYMILPPVEKRSSKHPYKAYWRNR